MKNSLKVLILIFVLVIVAGGIYLLINRNKDLKYIVISINPEIELAVNEDNIVKEVVGINEDAQILASDLDLIDLDLDEALEKVVDDAIETGYLDEFSDENTVIVKTMTDDEEEREQLQEKVVAKINNRLAEKKAYAVVLAYGLTEELKAQATELEISNGKMLLIDKAIAVNSELKAEDLATKSIKDIQIIIKDYTKSVKENAELKQAKEQLKTAYENKVKAVKDDLIKQAGQNPENMTEEQKNAALKDLVEGKKEELSNQVKEYVDKVKETIDSEGYKNIKEQVEQIREQVKNGKN